MIIEQSFSVAAPRSAVADFFTDVDRVSGCVPGVEGVRAVGDDSYEATLRAQLGPIAAAFRGTLRLDTAEAPQRLTALGEGRDQRSGSQARVEFVADLEEQGNVTEVRARADVVIRGRLGQFGTGIINSTARELVQEFARCVNANLADKTGPAGATRTAPRPAAAPSAMWKIALRGLAGWLLELARTAWATLRRMVQSRGKE